MASVQWLIILKLQPTPDPPLSILTTVPFSRYKEPARLSWLSEMRCMCRRYNDYYY